MSYMKKSMLLGALVLTAGAGPASAQVLHVHDRWEDCAIQLHPGLSAESWHRFASELGLVSYIRPMASARPLGAKKFEFGILQGSTKIDPASDAWNDTFSHPDSTHYLFEGDALQIPGLMMRVGVSDRIDVGASFTKNPNSNYGIAGGQVQYSLVDDQKRNVAAAARLSAGMLFGPDDVSASVYGLELAASREYGFVSPYVIVSGYLSHAQETTTKVDLPDENILGVQGTVGVAVNVWAVRLGAEYTAAKVSGYAFKVAFGT